MIQKFTEMLPSSATPLFNVRKRVMIYIEACLCYWGLLSTEQLDKVPGCFL